MEQICIYRYSYRLYPILEPRMDLPPCFKMRCWALLNNAGTYKLSASEFSFNCVNAKVQDESIWFWWGMSHKTLPTAKGLFRYDRTCHSGSNSSSRNVIKPCAQLGKWQRLSCLYLAVHCWTICMFWSTYHPKLFAVLMWLSRYDSWMVSCWF